MIELTETAKEQIATALEQQEGKTILRVEVQTNGTSEFAYGMKLIGEEEVTEEGTSVSIAVTVFPLTRMTSTS